MSIQSSNYKNLFQFHLGRCPKFSEEIISSSLPNISLAAVTTPSNFHDLKIPSNKYVFDPISVEFAIDENLEGYMEIFDWIFQIRSGTITSIADQTSDATLSILTNNMTPLFDFVFHGLFPVSLSELNFSAQSSSDVSLGSVLFDYNYLTVEARPALTAS
ncbi:MAG: hypothetical protein R8M45_10625 [Ghiorsea sp.]